MYFKVNFITCQNSFLGKNIEYPVQDCIGPDNYYCCESKEELNKELADKKMRMEKLGSIVTDIIIKEITVDDWIEFYISEIKLLARRYNKKKCNISDEEYKTLFDDKDYMADSIATLLEDISYLAPVYDMDEIFKNLKKNGYTDEELEKLKEG